MQNLADTSDLVDHITSMGISIIQKCRKNMAWETSFYQTLKQLSTWVGMRDVLNMDTPSESRLPVELSQN